MNNESFSKLIASTLSGLLLISSSSYSSHDGLVPVGKGDMKWHFFNLYEARLYADSGATPGDYPLALSLNYKRNISAENLVKATKKEWQRMELGDPLAALWLKKLEVLWPDVGPGDIITCFVDELGYASFYFNEALLGVIQNPEFSKNFLAIWLSDQARNQKLRLTLLGRSE